jgi:hypothetical protein
MKPGKKKPLSSAEERFIPRLCHLTEKIYLTEVITELPGDTYFPELDLRAMGGHLLRVR